MIDKRDAKQVNPVYVQILKSAVAPKVHAVPRLRDLRETHFAGELANVFAVDDQTIHLIGMIELDNFGLL